MATPEIPEYVDSNEAINMIGCSRSHLYKKAEQWGVEYKRDENGKWLFRRDHVVAAATSYKPRYRRRKAKTQPQQASRPKPARSVDTKKAAKLLGMSYAYFSKFAKKRFHRVRIGRQWFYPLDQIEAAALERREGKALTGHKKRKQTRAGGKKTTTKALVLAEPQAIAATVVDGGSFEDAIALAIARAPSDHPHATQLFVDLRTGQCKLFLSIESTFAIPVAPRVQA